jgi:transcriptional regulator with XRE-family HTH domain
VFVGQWIRALGKRPRDVARATEINEGYLSELVNGKKKNPSPANLAAIAEFLAIPMHYLYRLPPPKETLEQLAGFDPGTISRLGAPEKSDH